MTRANDPATKRERLFDLLASRNYTQPPWTSEELAAELCCSVRTVERLTQWLQDNGRIPRRRNYGGTTAIPRAANG